MVARRRSDRALIPHRPDLRLEFRIPLETEFAAALAAPPGPRRILLPLEDHDAADLLAGDAVERDGDELTVGGHGSRLVRDPDAFEAALACHRRGMRVKGGAGPPKTL